MATWVQCTETNDTPIWINLEKVASLKSVKEQQTWIAFIGAERIHTVVKETPEAILRMAHDRHSAGR